MWLSPSLTDVGSSHNLKLYYESFNDSRREGDSEFTASIKFHILVCDCCFACLATALVFAAPTRSKAVVVPPEVFFGSVGRSEAHCHDPSSGGSDIRLAEFTFTEPPEAPSIRGFRAAGRGSDHDAATSASAKSSTCLRPGLASMFKRFTNRQPKAQAVFQPARAASGGRTRPLASAPPDSDNVDGFSYMELPG